MNVRGAGLRGVARSARNCVRRVHTPRLDKEDRQGFGVWTLLRINPTAERNRCGMAFSIVMRALGTLVSLYMILIMARSS